MVRVLANGPENRGSIPDRVIPKTEKILLDASLFNSQHFKGRINCKKNNLGKGVAPSPRPPCSSYL